MKIAALKGEYPEGLPSLPVSSGSELTFVFHSDGNINNNGFAIAFSTSEAKMPETAGRLLQKAALLKKPTCFK